MDTQQHPNEEEINDLEIEAGEDESEMGDDVDMDSVCSHPGPSLRSRAITILTAILQTNLVWYVAGLVDGLILLKLFGG